MKQILFITLSVLFCVTLFSQNKTEEYQDPAYWIALEENSRYVPVSIVPRKDQVPVMYSAPIKFKAVEDKNLSEMKLSIDFLKYEFDEDGRQIVHFNGTLDLKCCRSRPVNMEFYNLKDNLVQFARTDENGKFKLKSINGGNVMEIKNYKLKLNFYKVKTIDENWDERFATIGRAIELSDKEIARMQKKELRKIQKDKDFRNN